MNSEPSHLKRKSNNSPPTNDKDPVRRRLNSPTSPSVPTPMRDGFVPFIERRTRPKKWRGKGDSDKRTSKAAVLQPFQEELKTPTSNILGPIPENDPERASQCIPILQSIYEDTSTTNVGTSNAYLYPREKVELRLSFTAPFHLEDEELNLKDKAISTASPQGVTKHAPLPNPREALATTVSQLNSGMIQTDSPQTRIIPQIPILVPGPTPKREGYGFSYTDSLFYDPADYPDTDNEWSPPGSGAEKPTTSNLGLPPFTQSDPFDDNIVVRDVASFHVAKPQRVLPCTSATREDTIVVKRAAKELQKYAESDEICAELLARVETMVTNTIEEKALRQRNAGGSAVQCAVRLWEFLIRIKDERVETGESVKVVEHEVEWANWMVDAARKGVLHLKTRECQCRPGWEE